jgi:SPP1 gp7 family putative phage head morphogenesis protein
VHLKLWSPYDEERGSGDWPAAQVAAEADYASGQFALSLARNNGDTGPYIVPKAGPPAPEQIEQMKKQLLEKRYLNQSGKWAPTFMSADVDVVDPQIRVPDAAFYSGRVQNRDEIATAFGIPPSMFDKVASYSVGSASDYFKLINECCVPLAEKIADALEPLVSKLARQPVRARFNFDEHPTMQQVRAERTEAAKSYWGMGMPMAVINDWLNLGIPEYEGWDIGYLPFSVAPVSEERGAADDPGFDEANADDTEDASDDPEEVAASLRRAFDERAQARAAEAEADAGETFQDGRPEAELAQWESHMAKRRPVIKAYESAFTRELMKARAEVLAKLDAYSPPEKALEGARSRAVAADFLFDLEAFREGLLGALRKVAASALQLAGEDIFSELALDDPWQVAPEAVLNFIRRREVKLRDIPEEIAGRIRSALAEGIDAGESQPKLMTRIRGEFNTISKAKARTIAQTETSAAYGSGRQEAMEAAGVTHKKWLTSGNANVRPSHRAANGQTVPISSDYTVGGAHLSHPGDSTGPAGEVINCHCISIPTTAPTDE